MPDAPPWLVDAGLEREDQVTISARRRIPFSCGSLSERWQYPGPPSVAGSATVHVRLTRVWRLA